MAVKITIERLKEVFSLEEDGRLLWKKAGPNRRIGREAGWPYNGYRFVNIDYQTIGSHRIVFAMTRGRWAVHEIDHINGIKNDNRPCNLREATRSQNQHNRNKQTNNKSGFKGVGWFASGRKWRARIKAYGKTRYLGYFSTPEEASIAYQAAAKLYHGEFAFKENNP